MRVYVEVRIDAGGMNASSEAFGNMQLREDFDLPVGGFTELAAILGQFHALGLKIKKGEVET